MAMLKSLLIKKLFLKSGFWEILIIYKNWEKTNFWCLAMQSIQRFNGFQSFLKNKIENICNYDHTWFRALVGQRLMVVFACAMITILEPTTDPEESKIFQSNI
jgi:hypothetical protein